ncbi:uncharacterized protein ACLA_037940 [Aspergillus clavatus NRRL 1]|uniref:Uncharacterized protein n=1 Tax=Aspergillus clavatus (strain ATCC 1007 / CBS 513.65 / DSM 816 / NCTC 3887 / NRRL 1 / QM 1276 / 107) TaxID=344612 RepID=A1CKB0_ASPCL|nr:uncharacterized protein ACLA_037940 [Aspergillus clavatus NRRL 1]EAW09584.1 hypothetical protein ACLA_037940 [Aspergillus clavatus NRRL 1]
MCLSAPSLSSSAALIRFTGCLANCPSLSVNPGFELALGETLVTPALSDTQVLSTSLLFDYSVAEVVWLGVHGPS